MAGSFPSDACLCAEFGLRGAHRVALRDICYINDAILSACDDFKDSYIFEKFV